MLIFVLIHIAHLHIHIAIYKLNKILKNSINTILN